MRSALSAVLVLLVSSRAPAQEGGLKEARQRWLKGNYAEAMDRYEKLAKDEKTKVPAALGISQALQSQGEYDKALETVDAAIKDAIKDARLHARRAELLYLRGRWEEAEKAADAAVAIDKENFPARWVLAQVYRDRGDVKKADVEFRWFVRTYSARSDAEMDIKDPDLLLLVGLAGSENARWHNLSDQFEFILKDVYGDALKYDKDYWPAEHAAGALLLEKYNRAEGLAALDKALTINPNAAEALVGKGFASLQRFEMRDAEKFAEQALAINPNLPDALRLRADVHLAVGDTKKAMKELDSARKINPRDEHTLGRVGACLLLEQKPRDFDALLAEVKKVNPTPGVFHSVVAERLDDRRRFADAEKHFVEARKLRPMLSGATGSLGMLYMRMGREKEAKELLDKAFEADPFNVRVSNMRKVMRHLEKYETIKTAHFEVRFDPQSDGPLARFLAEFLEATYADLAKKFNHQPKGPILVEVFNNHEMFSGRTIALPDLHTIGACTGRMVAMVSPQGKGIRKPFNWARVMRHELVHIFNLDQTNFLLPHWFTEGLAVQSEGFDRPQIWNQLLKQRVPSGELLNLETIDLGFIRPRNPLEWQMAYCQSQLYIQYIEKTYGQKAVADMLDAFRDGLDAVSAIRKVCKVEREPFEKGYKGFLDDLVKTIGGKEQAKSMTLAELKAAVEKDPDNPDLMARLAESSLRTNRTEARKLARQALEKKDKHPLASYVLARLAILAGDADEAKKLLEQAVDKDNPEPKVLLALGKIYSDAGEDKKAAELFELGRKAEPYDSAWLEQLARLYARTEEKDKQIEVLKALAHKDADDLDVRKRVAKLLTAKPAEAERYAREVLEIDVNDKDARDVLYKALEDQNKAEEAARLRKMLEK